MLFLKFRISNKGDKQPEPTFTALAVEIIECYEDCVLPEWLEELDSRRYGAARLVFGGVV